MNQNPLVLLTVTAALAWGLTLKSHGQDARTEQVNFEPGRDNAVITGRITGEEYVLYKLNARDGQFLSVSLRPDNQSTDFNIYIPGRGPGDEALYASGMGGREYSGQLYKSGDHTVSVFLNRNAARRGDVANYDIVFRITAEPAGPIPAEVPPAALSPTTSTASNESPWDKATIETRDHAPLLERQAALPADLAKTPVAIALLVLDRDMTGVVTDVSADYDTMESPAEVEITITEGGILDDDLHAIRHQVSMARNSNNEWRIVGYGRGELRRSHLK